jgi:hypothetical protein
MQHSELIPGEHYMVRGHSGSIVEATLKYIHTKSAYQNQKATTFYVCQTVKTNKLLRITKIENFVSRVEK